MSCATFASKRCYAKNTIAGPQHLGLNAFVTKPQVKPPWTKIKRRPDVVAIKDNIVTTREPTTCGSGILQQHQSPYAAHVVETLLVNDAQISGKTNLDEFGMGSHSTHSSFGAVRREAPYKHLSAGGSSGGSAVAVASKQVHIGLGTDTGGSVRLPAAYTGTLGFKPSYGQISRWGVIPYANSLDTVGFFANKINMLLKTFRSLAVPDPRDPSNLSLEFRLRSKQQRRSSIREGLKKYRIGVPLEYNLEELDPGVRMAWQTILNMFQDEGHEIVSISLPNTKHALSAYYVLAAAEAASNLSKYDGVRYGIRAGSADGAADVLYSATRGQGFGDETKRRILLGSYSLSSNAIDNYFIKAQKVRRLVQRDFDRVFALRDPLREEEQFDLSEMDEKVDIQNKQGPAQVDFIICPTAPSPPPKLSDVEKQSPVDKYLTDVFTIPASLAGLPAISVPIDIPEPYRQPGNVNYAGMQIIGQHSSDFRVIMAMLKIEKYRLGNRKRSKKERKHDKDGRKTIGMDGESASTQEDFARNEMEEEEILTT